MKPVKIDHRSIRNLSDIRLERQKLKYALVIQEQTISKSIAGLGVTLNDTFRSAAYNMGLKLAYAVILNLLRRRRK